MNDDITYVTGWLLPKGINVEPQEVLVPSNAGMIADMIGCDLIDAITNMIGRDDEDVHTVIVGYIDDEGLFKRFDLDNPFADVNHLAITLFDRDDVIMGDVVVVCAHDADGVNDGDNHDLPSWVLELSQDLTAMSAIAYNESMALMSAVANAVKDGVIDADEVTESLGDFDSTDIPSEFIELLAVAARYTMMAESDDATTGIVEGFEQLLQEEN